MIRSIFNKLFNRNDDVALYRYVSQEIANKHIDQGLWAKAFSMSGGDENKARAKYIELRVQYLKDESRRLAEERPANSAHEKIKPPKPDDADQPGCLKSILIIPFAIWLIIFMNDSKDQQQKVEAEKKRILQLEEQRDTAAEFRRNRIQPRLEAEVNKRYSDLPRRFDKYTILDRVTVSGDVLVFLMRTSSVFTEQDKLDWQTTMTRAVCTSSIIRPLINSGAFYRFIYKDKNGATFLHFTIGASECASI